MKTALRHRNSLADILPYHVYYVNYSFGLSYVYYLEVATASVLDYEKYMGTHQMQKGRQEEHRATFFVIYRIKIIYHCAGTKATIVVHCSQKTILSHQQFVQHKCRKAGSACVMNVESNKLMASSSSSFWLIFLPLSFNKPQSSPSFEAWVLLYFPCSSKVLFVSCFRTLLGYLAKAAVRADLTLRLVSF